MNRKIKIPDTKVLPLFTCGDDAIVTHQIRRKDGRSTVNPGERVKITSVFQGNNYTVVSIEPYSGTLPMIDICCDLKGPLRPTRSGEEQAKKKVIPKGE